MYVYLAPAIESSHDQGFLKRIKRVQEQIETGDPLLFGLLFSPRFPYWVKRISENQRLIASLKRVGTEWVLCFTHLLSRGGGEYRAFLDNPEQWGKDNIRLNETILENWLYERQQVKPIERRPVPDHLHGWLRKPTLLQRSDRVIFESQLWVEAWSEDKSEVSANWQSFHRILVHLLSPEVNRCRVESTQYQGVKLCTDPDTDCTVVYGLVRPSDAPNRQILFLLSAHTHHPSRAEIAPLSKTLRMFGMYAGRELFSQPATVDDLARFARRSYPDYLVWDEDIWKDLEHDTETNLALSGEEEELLHDMLFPAFINGRAGSGKSTMLHYAFAYYCDLYLSEKGVPSQDTNGESFRPLFLTYSDRLSRKAYDVVQKVLVSHSHYLNEPNNYPEGWQNQLEDCFQPFGKFLKAQLPEEVASTFGAQTYISFHRFKTLYIEAFHRPECSAEVAWHTIRTYIKGFNFSEDNGEFLSTDEYISEVDRSQKSVDNETFRYVFDHVWKWYQNLQREHKYWDDQDLARAVLIATTQDGKSRDRYAAIFCDEAQDFTRLEFQVILRLSVWSQYRLYGNIDSLPFAFAGDPMQTLNPTGFDWKNLRASFYDRILSPLDPDHSIGLCRSDYTLLRELKQNYRSTRCIVRFGNVVHLWRRILFDIQSLKPQIPWWDEQQTIPIQKGIWQQNLALHDLQSLINRDIVFILPCDPGGERDFLSKNPAIQNFFPNIDLDKPLPNIYSAAEIKGMEFPLIVVCGFGEYFAHQFKGRSLGELAAEREDLQLEYFLNKLYVAVSRPTQVLGIVDTQEGDRLLWQSANTTALSDWLGRLPHVDRAQWKSETQDLQEYFNLTAFQNGDPLEIARTFMKDGLANPNQRFFESAAHFYERANHGVEAEYCRTWVERLEGNLREAGQGFMRLQDLNDPSLNPHRDAWECFWQGQHWQEILEWCDRFPSALETQWRPAANFMVQMQAIGDHPKSEALQRIHLTSDFTTFAVSIVSQGHALSAQCEDSTWQSVFGHYRDGIEQLISTAEHISSIEGDRWASWQNALCRIGEAGFDHDQSLGLAARCAYHAQRYDQAVQFWEQCKDEKPYRISNNDYFLAKAITSPLPENIQWFRRANHLEEIIALWHNHTPTITDEWESAIEHLCYALEQHKHYADLIEIHIQLSQWVQAIQYFTQHESDDPPLGNELRLSMLRRMAIDERLAPEAIEREVKQIMQMKGSFLTKASESDGEPEGRKRRGKNRSDSAHSRKVQDPFTSEGRREDVRQKQEIFDKALEDARHLLCTFIADTTKLQQWEISPHNIDQAGDAFDRVGEFIPTLKFYEQFRSYTSSDIRELARSRWAAVKYRYATYLEQMGRTEIARRQREDADRSEQLWKRKIETPTKRRSVSLHQVQEQLEGLSEPDLLSVSDYIRFLEFQRRSES